MLLPVVTGVGATAGGLVCTLLLRVMCSTAKDESFRLVRGAADGRALAESCGHVTLGKRILQLRFVKEQVAVPTWHNFP